MTRLSGNSWSRVRATRLGRAGGSAAFGEALIAASSAPDSPLHPMTQLASGLGPGLGPVHRRRFGLQNLEHDGGGPGFVSWFVAIPDRHLVLAIAWNANGESPEVSRRFAAALDEILAIILGRDAEAGMVRDRTAGP